jgi:hypothetical protein
VPSGSATRAFAFVDPLKSALYWTVHARTDRRGKLTPLSSVGRAVAWKGAKAPPELGRFLQMLGTEDVHDQLGADN